MSQDIVSDALNQIMNAKRSGKSEVTLNKHSKLLLNILVIAKEHGYIEEFIVEDRVLIVKFKKINKCQSIKPRFYVQNEDIDKYVRRYLPGRGFGILIISTNQGLITNQEADEKKIGGSLIAYFY